MEKEFEKEEISKLKTTKQYKNLFRNPVPDKMRRDIILQFFNLNPMTCETRYETIVKMAGEEFVDHT